AVQVGPFGADPLGGADQSGLVGGRFEAEVREDVGAVVQGAHADEVGGAVDLAVDGDRLPGGGVGVLGLVPGGELLADVGESAVLHVAGRVGVAVLDEVGRGGGVVEGGLDALGAGLDGDVLDGDLGALVRLLEAGHDGVDDLLLGLVVDLLEQPHPQGAGPLVLVGGGVAGGLGGARDGGGEDGRGGDQTDGQLHGAPPRCCNIRNGGFAVHNTPEARDRVSGATRGLNHSVTGRRTPRNTR